MTLTRPHRGIVAGLCSVLAATVLASLLGVSGPASAKPRPAAPHIVVRNGVTQPVFSYEDAIRETVYVESLVDGDRNGRPDLLATDIIRPKETEDGLKVPAIYEMSPYYQTLGRGNESETKEMESGDFKPEFFPLFYDNYFVPRGYAFIAQDMPGTRNSEGCMVLGGPQELVAAKATMRWLNGKGKAFDGEGNEVEATWATGWAGMIGKSYDGTIANAAASMGLPGLRTIVPIAGISRWYDYHLNNGVQYPNAYSTPELFVFVIDQQPGDDYQRGLGWLEATFGENGPCTKRASEIAAHAGDPRANYGKFWVARDYLRNADRVKASVFLIHGRNDLNVKPNHYIQWWNALARRDVPRKIWLSQTGHVDPFDFRRAVFVRTLHRWFDRWLHGIRNGIMNEPMADIERTPDHWVRKAVWPDPRSSKVALFLRQREKGDAGHGRLALKPQVKPRTRTFTDDPTQTESEMASHPRATKPGRLVFLTRRLPRDVRLSGGPIRVSIRASVDRPDTNFTALLVDYGIGDPITRRDYGGSGEGITTLDEETCWGESTDADDACYGVAKTTTRTVPYEIVTWGFLDARHYRTLKSNTLLETGKVYRFRWPVWGEDWIFEKGHRIGLVIAGSDGDMTIPDESEAQIAVQLEGSKVVIPIVGGGKRLKG